MAAYGILLSITLIWGATFPVVQIALRDASPFAFMAVRFAIAAVVFGAVFRRLRKITRTDLIQGLILGALNWGGYAFQTIGLTRTTAARSGFITGLLVPLTPVFAWLIFRERIGLRLWLAVLLAFMGLWIMSRPEAGGLNSGDVLTLCCAIIFALYVVCVGRWANPGNDVQLVWLQLTTSAVLATLALPFESGAHFDVSSGRLVSITVFTALFCSAFASWAQLKYQPRLSPAVAAVIYACEPVFAGIFSWILLNYVPTVTTLYGAGFIVTGMLLSSLSSRPKPTFS